MLKASTKRTVKSLLARNLLEGGMEAQVSAPSLIYRMNQSDNPMHQKIYFTKIVMSNRINRIGSMMTIFSYGKGLRFGTWNVKSFISSCKTVSRFIDRYQLGFLGMSEVRWNHLSQLNTSNGI